MSKAEKRAANKISKTASSIQPTETIKTAPEVIEVAGKSPVKTIITTKQAVTPPVVVKAPEPTKEVIIEPVTPEVKKPVEKKISPMEMVQYIGSEAFGKVTEVATEYAKIQTVHPITGKVLTVLTKEKVKFGKDVKFKFDMYMSKYTAVSVEEIGENTVLAALVNVPLVDVMYSSDFKGTETNLIGRTKDGKYVVIGNDVATTSGSTEVQPAKFTAFAI
jgi:hypothetical protein